MEMKREAVDEEKSHTPAFFEISETNASDKPGKRIFYILRTKGCAKALSGNTCTMCDFNKRASKDIAEADLVAQVDGLFALQEIHEIVELHISAIGSFFDDEELPKKVREYILKRAAAAPNIIKVSVETKASDVDEKKLKKAKKFLRKDQEFEIGVGYETQDENIREGVLNKKISKHDLNECINKCCAAGVAFKAFVLIKPPPMTEEEAIEEAVETALYVFRKCKEYCVRGKVSFQPLFIAGSILRRLYEDKGFTPPNLWTVVEVIKQTVMAKEQESLPGKIYCAFNDENIGGELPDSCPECKDKIISAIRRFNASQSLEEFEKLDCPCRGIDRISKTITADVADMIKAGDASESHKPLTDEEYQLLLFGYINLENVFGQAQARKQIPIYEYYGVIEKTISDLMSLRKKMPAKFMVELRRIKKLAESKQGLSYGDYKMLVALMENEINRRKRIISGQTGF